MTTKNLFFLTFLILLPFVLLGQSAGIFADSSGRVFIQEKLPAYFFIAPVANSSEKVMIPSDDPNSNPMYFDGNGVHYLRIPDAKTKKIIKYRIFADGLPPQVSLSFQSGLLMCSGKRFYAEKGAIAKVIGNDKLSGVKEIFYSINNSSYSKVIDIVFSEEINYWLKVFAIDNVGNISDTSEFYVITAVNSIVKMDNIYFDIGSANLRSESRSELNEFARILNQYPEVHIELRAHTDSRGDKNYNQLLSERRAEEVANYLVRMGVKPDRLSTRGFGESLPVNECVKGVKCPEEKMQLNRRVEFQILPIRKKP